MPARGRRDRDTADRAVARMNVRPAHAIGQRVLLVIRFVASLAILLWGLTMVLLGLGKGFFLWIAIGFAVTAVGLPLLGSHPWASKRLYPRSGNIEGASPPEPVPPPAA